jgi:vitamin B12 transporter
MFYALRFRVLVVCCIAVAGHLRAQTDSTRLLREVQIEAAQSRLAPIGQVQYRLDSSQIQLQSAQHTGDALRAHGLANVRTYGAALTASVALRGGAANQTALVWNGFKLQKPASGLVDFSLAPVALFDALTVVPGAQSALWGSSAVGGIVSLQNLTPEQSGLQLHHARGAFGLQQSDVKIALKRQKWTSVTRAATQRATHDFSYHIPGTEIRKKQTHAASEFQNVLQELVYQPFSNIRLMYFLWANRAEREIPPLVTQTTSRAKQWDGGLRNAFDAQWRGARHTTEFRCAHLRESIDYRDSAVLVFSEIQFTTLTAEAESQVRISLKNTLHGGLNFTQNAARAPGYTQGVAQVRNAGFLSWKTTMGRVSTQTDLRSIWGDGRFIAWVPALGLRFDARNWASFRLRASRTFREPTLNDLYWEPGGNPNLKEELGWSLETGADMLYQTGGWSLRYFGTAYWRNTRNLIYWAPKSGSPFWSPDNVAEVRTIGLENRLEVAKKLSKHTAIRVHGTYEPVAAINQIPLKQPSIKKGEQLWYVPKFQMSLGAQITFYGYQFGYQYQKSGAVASPEGGLDGVGLHHANLSKQIQIKKSKVLAYARLDNIFHKTWYSIDRRPMPGRNGSIGLKFQI